MYMMHLSPDKNITDYKLYSQTLSGTFDAWLEGSTSCVLFQRTYSDRDISGCPSTWKGFCLAREHYNLLTFLVINQTHGIYWCPEIRTQSIHLKSVYDALR